MGRKVLEIDPRIGNDRVGMIITRGQVEHLGHAALKAQMLVDNSTNIVGFGSSQKSGVYDNPLDSDQKRRAQQGAWGDAFKMIFLQDIGATDRSTDWADYVFDRIKSNQLAEPTDFYAGSKHEARWYAEHFAALDGAPDYTRGMFQVWENPDNGKRIHILDRNLHVPISSSEVRSMIERRDTQWRSFVPQTLWAFYEWEYPPELRAAVDIDAMTDQDLPVGTKGIYPSDPNTILILRDDGKWRERNEAEMNAKSLGD
jgi:hypothetical protein